MIKKITLLLISLFLISCTSPYIQKGGIEFKDRNGTYKNNDGTIIVIVKDTDDNNISINIANLDGLGTVSETYSVTSAVTTGKFSFDSKIHTSYEYMVNFNGNTSITFSVRKGTTYPINSQELKNTK
ncbi:hypothetical protein [Brachyspira hampsonii]|uniref:Lipoprotein n=1 Tax=Brachyspira hampsonii 30446 TaxID=1289135 RepID=A0A2U4F4H9_9SPIR|nr:hypothetical protein [Brachyspira hampsonii]EKV55830.1 hypothetical protein A966_13295 [Brachyspira hampsonii 30446]MBW5390360.1 hypothetical protein [Brachyspira hampsonii]MBW5395580.1 hypothetical protein [Brachyspira hampsonii]OEJ13383.1 hypothetical protein A9495_10225 [Brachyspira hampsonii]